MNFDHVLTNGNSEIVVRLLIAIGLRDANYDIISQLPRMIIECQVFMYDFSTAYVG